MDCIFSPDYELMTSPKNKNAISSKDWKSQPFLSLKPFIQQTHDPAFPSMIPFHLPYRFLRTHCNQLSRHCKSWILIYSQFLQQHLLSSSSRLSLSYFPILLHNLVSCRSIVSNYLLFSPGEIWKNEFDSNMSHVCFIIFIHVCVPKMMDDELVYLLKLYAVVTYRSWLSNP